MKRIFAALALIPLVPPAGPAGAHDQGQAAHIAGAKGVTVTQVYVHHLPGIPGKSMRGVLTMPPAAMPRRIDTPGRRSFTPPSSRGRCAIRSMTGRSGFSRRRELDRNAR